MILEFSDWLQYHPLLSDYVQVLHVYDSLYFCSIKSMCMSHVSMSAPFWHLPMFGAEWIHESPLSKWLEWLRMRWLARWSPGLRKFDEKKKPPKLEAGLLNNFNLK